ncbi:integral peroxisomal membrane peroxin-domain-containing protein [Triangularia verruculosa]|uniref:Integral peroxisomal membrane peroxin-domain-containing protein n=1 Tax=Triangularia verruculosa TaxID=2587418 RepID=A0AAN6XFN7_9PEZI|nr:integral peroxisomal membrane peroxin-domain-containing protein [Triangularia verruculosa]
MAAFEPPWLTHMSAPPRAQRSDQLDPSSQHPSTPSRGASHANDGAASSVFSTTPNPTYASFSPATLSSTNPSTASAAKRRSTILVHQKSPLLLATPPQITRALAYSHPFLLPLNNLVGLLTWTTADAWESFLLVAFFWAAVLYGDFLVRATGPLILVLILILGMYGRRFSPLSSSGWTEPGVGAGDGTAAATDTKGAKTLKTSKSKNLLVDGLPEKTTKAENGTATTPSSGHKRNQGSISEATNTRHQKTLDEIVETLKELTARCNILLEPLLELTDFLSTQQTATSATTRPALTTLFVRILLCTPFWFLLTLPPLRIITTRRVILLFGTIILTWHARVMRVTRAILWRSATIRKLLTLVTGLQFDMPVKAGAAAAAAAAPSTDAPNATSSSAASTKTKSSATGTIKATRHESELTKALRRARGGQDTGVRFTFIIYENQRRWVGLGWTTSLFAYERPAWTDEHNNAVPQRDDFELPEVEDGSNMRWRWVEGSRWKVDGVPDDAVMSEGEKGWDYDGPGGKVGWIYYDNKWQNGRRGQDGWGKWTRRRKWYRDAELVEADADEVMAEDATSNEVKSIPSVDLTPSTPATTVGSPPPTNESKESLALEREREEENDTASMLSTSSRSTSRFIKPSSLRKRVTDASSLRSGSTRRASGMSGSLGSHSEDYDDDAGVGTLQTRLAMQDAGKEEGSWGVGDEVINKNETYDDDDWRLGVWRLWIPSKRALKDR